MKALVTGGGGFLGLYIVEQLCARGDNVTVFCRGTYDRHTELGVTCVRGDIRDADAVAAACADQDIVFHTAAVPGVWGSWKHYYSTNTVGTRHVVAGCQAGRVRRLVFTSSPSVVYDGAEHLGADESLSYPDSYLCHYPHSKALAERAVLEANSPELATTALRPHLIWGPRDNHLIPRLIQRARSGRLRRVGDGTNLISMSYVENAAQAHLQAADVLSPDSANAGRAYFINEPEPVNLWEWIDELLTLAGLPPVQRSISAKAASRIGGVLEGFFRVFGLPGEPPMTRFVASQLSSSHYYDISQAVRDFGYTPLKTVRQGMERVEPELRRLANGATE